jgi:hypothetical protein
MKTQPCPKCRSLGNDRAGDNFVFFGNGHWHCFSCQHHVFPEYFVPKKEKLNVSKSLLPSDFTREVPAGCFKWLLQYGLPWSYWKDKVGYSPSTERLVFLVGEPMQFSIGRYVGTSGLALSRKEQPRKWYVWGDSHKHCEIVGASSSEDSLAVAAEQRQIVLVEDLVSAHKLGSAGYVSIPLFGTEIHKCHLYYLMHEQKPVVLWLDKDQQGSIMRKAVGLQALIGQEVRCIVTDSDPKELTKEEIVENLKM